MSTSTDPGKKEDDESDSKQYDDLVDRSGHRMTVSRSTDQLSTSAAKLEREFREQYNKDNMDQFRRVLIALSLMYGVKALIGTCSLWEAMNHCIICLP